MHLVGRYRRVCGIGMYPYTYIIDYRKNCIHLAGDSWIKGLKGQPIPIPQGGSTNDPGYSSLFPPVGIVPLRWNSTPAAVTTTLNNAYVAGSTGTASGGRITVAQDEIINEIYFHANSYQGTPTSLNIEIRTGTSLIPSTAGGSLLESKVYDPGNVVGWHKVTGWNTAITAGVPYWIIIADANGTTGDNVIVLNRFTIDNNPVTYSRMMAVTTANGFSSVTRHSGPSSLPVKFASGRSLALPWVSLITGTSNTLQKGLYIDNIYTSFKAYAILNERVQSAFSAVRVWKGATGPSGDPVTGGGLELTNMISDNASTGLPMGVIFPPYTIESGIAHRFVFTYTVNNGDPRRVSAGSSADAFLLSHIPGQGGWGYTIDDGAGGWSNELYSLSNMTILVDEYNLTGGGGGSGGMSKGRLVAGG